MSEFFKSIRARKIYGIAALSVTLLCAVLRTLSIFFFFDKDIGYYQTGAALPIIFELLTIVSIIAAIVFSLVKPICVSFGAASDAPYVKYLSLLPAVGLAVFTLTYVKELLSNLSAFSFTWQIVLTLISSIGACVFFVMIALTKSRANVAYVLTGCTAVIWLVTALASSYFDSFVQMNSPNKIIFIFGALGGMLLAVNEMRRGLDDQKPGLHLLGATAASILLTACSLPSLIGFLAKKMPLNYSNFYYDIVFFSLAIFAVARLVQLCFGTNTVVATQAENITSDEDNSEIEANENQEQI